MTMQLLKGLVKLELLWKKWDRFSSSYIDIINILPWLIIFYYFSISLRATWNMMV